MPFSLNFRYRWHDMPLIQPYLTHLRSLLPSWRARRAVDSHLASPSLDRHHLLISRALRQNFCAVTHSFFLTPLNVSSTSSRPDTKGLLSSVPSKEKKEASRQGARSIVKVRQETQALRRRGSCAGDPLPPDSVPSLFAALCELLSIRPFIRRYS